MLALTSSPIYLFAKPVDMRKSFDGLSILVESAFPGHLLSGELFVFVNRRQTQLKALYWHEDGLVIWHKRLEKGTFKVSWNGKCLLSRREFSMLLEGITPQRLNRRYISNKKM